MSFLGLVDRLVDNQAKNLNTDNIQVLRTTCRGVVDLGVNTFVDLAGTQTEKSRTKGEKSPFLKL